MKRLGAVALLCALAAGCGGDKQSLPNVSTKTTISSRATTTTAPRNGPTTEPQDPKDTTDIATAQKLVLTTSDIPSGWTESRPQDESNDPFRTEANQCLGEPKQSDMTVGIVDGNDFSQGGDVISSEADVYNTAQLAQQDQAKTLDKTTWDCVANVTVESVKTNYLVDDLNAVVSAKIQTIDGVTTAANQLAVRQIVTIHSTSQGNHTLYSDVVGYTTGRIGVTANLQFTDSEPPQSLDKAFLAKLLAHQTSSGTGRKL